MKRLFYSLFALGGLFKICERLFGHRRVKRAPLVSLLVAGATAGWLGAEPIAEPAAARVLASIPSQTAVSATVAKRFQSTFQEGEDFLYAIRWGAITGGHSTLSVRSVQDVDGRPAYHLVSEAHSSGIVDSFYHVDDRNEAWLDAETPRSLRYSQRIREGKYHVDDSVVLNYDEKRFHRVKHRIDKSQTKETDGELNAPVLDVFSSLYYVRTLPLEVGKSFTVDVHSGNKIYPLIVKVKRRETVKVKAGKFDCFRVEPMLREPGLFVSKGKSLEVWITADSRRMPVLMRSEIFIGHVSAELVRARQTAPETAVELSGLSAVPDVN
jgi:hypothetical protein